MVKCYTIYVILLDFGGNMLFVTIPDKHLSPINPTQFGYQNCEKSHAFGPAIRTHWLIHFVVSGCGTFCIGDRKHKLSSGEMFVIPPWVETYYEADAHDPWSYIWVGFEADSLPVTLDEKIFCPSALSVFHDMKRCEELEGGMSLFIASKILELFALLEARKGEEEGYVERARAIISSQYMLGIGVEDIARELNLNRSYFSDIFKKSEGISPAKYLMNYRMELAGSLLSGSKISVSTVANSVGYSDVFNFSKAFKKYWGCSPQEYSKRQRITKAR
jgi:AraC-like DNA-binding protein